MIILCFLFSGNVTLSIFRFNEVLTVCCIHVVRFDVQFKVYITMTTDNKHSSISLLLKSLDPDKNLFDDAVYEIALTPKVLCTYNVLGSNKP